MNMRLPTKAAGANRGWLLLLVQLYILALGMPGEGLSQSGKQADSIQTSCDNLFRANDNLASYCHCSDNSDSSTGQQLPAESINQLDCSPQSLAQIIEDLQSVGRLTFRVDFLNIKTNLARLKSSSTINHNNNSLAIPLQQQPSSWPLRVDHMSVQLQLQLRYPGEEPEKVQEQSWRGRHVSQTNKRLLQEQMINLAASINGTHLQFLSLFMDTPEDERGASDTNNNELTPQEVDLFELLNRFSGLNRLELSLAADSGSSATAWTLRPNSPFGSVVLRAPSSPLGSFDKLKWLNLASNGRINFGEPFENETNSKVSPFYYINSLEHISFEDCNLRRFPLESLFALNNLTSLNLAANKLASLERDLFLSFAQQNYCKEMANNKNANLLLASLVQLDLSYNELEEISAEAGQCLLCSMPQLNQLHLHHNKIKHLNLNSLLQVPAFKLPVDYYSKLEYIDLSHNQLVRISGLGQPPMATGFASNISAATSKLKHLNLAFNYLSRPLHFVNATLLNRIIFPNSIAYNLNQLEASFQIYNFSQAVTLCDFLWPNNLQVHPTSDSGQELLLDNNELEIISADFSSSRCKSITILSLSRNKITKLDWNAFGALKILESLDLSGNYLSHLQDFRLFSQNVELKFLDLSRNKLRQIERSIFLQLVKLEELFLNDNELSILPAEFSFTQNPRLTVIDLSRNKIATLNYGLFMNLNNLQRLSISDNNLKQFNHNLFDGTSLSVEKHLVMQKTAALNVHDSSKLSKQPKQWQKGNKKTDSTNKRLAAQQKRPQEKHRNLIRRSTSIAAISPDQGATNLLSLDSNSIEFFKFIDAGSSNNCTLFLRNIEHLSLRANRLRDLQNSSFKCMPYIQRLILSQNSIKNIESQAFTHLKYLTHLDLAQNKLNRMQALPEVPLHLDLSQNELVDFKPGEIFPPLASDASNSIEFEQLDLSFNSRLRLQTGELIELLSVYNPKRLNLAGIESIKQSVATHKNEISFILESINLSHIGEQIDDVLVEFLASAISSIGRLDLSFLDIPINKPDNKIDTLVAQTLKNGLRELTFAGNLYNFQQFIRMLSGLSGEPVDLEYLNLSSNRLDAMPLTNQTHKQLSNLRHLDMSQNKLRYFLNKEQCQFQFRELEILNLSSNSLVSLVEPGSWPNNQQVRSLYELGPKLRHLDLSNNRLTWLPVQLFQTLNSLSSLNLAHNHFENVPAGLLDSIILASSPNIVINFSNNKRLLSIGSNRFKPMTSNSPTSINSVQSLLDNLDLQIILTPNPIRQPKQLLTCSSIDYFVNLRRSNNTNDLNLELETHGVGLNAQDDQTESRLAKEMCRLLLDSIDCINLDSTFAKSDAISINSPRLVHLSLSENSLYLLEPLDKSLANSIVSLDLSNNKLQDLDDHNLVAQSYLRSLDLSYNQIRQVPKSLLESNLTFLNLGSNKISSLKNLKHLRSSSSILALKLDNNYLTELSEDSLNRLKRLRYLDLRWNLIKAAGSGDLYQRTPRALFIEESHPTSIGRRSYKFQLTANDQSIEIERIGSNNASGSRYSLEIDGSAVENSDNRLIVNYCSLQLKARNEICLKMLRASKLEQDEDFPEVGACFQLVRSPNVRSCLTSLTEPGNNGTSIAQPLADSSRINVTSGGSNQSDFVLDTIESAKNYWLQLREFEVNKYLLGISNVSPDSIWVKIQGKYPIYTITLLKMSIVFVSSCIVLLLIIMFTLLTCNTAGRHSANRKQEHSSPLSQSEMTVTTTERNDITGCSSTTIDKSSSSQDQSSQQETVLENRKKTLQQLDTAHLLFLNQQQQCYTPNSSLAPSSVETAETLQAIDSIQSGSNPAELTGSQFRNPHEQTYGNQQRQVATVMRMVKSNSASFSNQPGNSDSNNNHYSQYGTLNSNSNSNYSQLRSKLRVIPQNRQIFPKDMTNLYAFDQQQHDPFYRMPQEQQSIPSGFESTTSEMVDQNDPTTMSLLSLNSALSGPTHVINSAQPNQQMLPANFHHAPAPSLCHYHRLASGGELNNQPINNEIILEQEEEQFLSEHSMPVPPPTSRAIEALQNPLSFNFYTTNNNDH